MKKHVCILQTSFAKRDDTIAYLKSQLPDLRISFITDDTLLADTKKIGYPDHAIVQRMTLYAMAAESMGADVIFNTCSSVSEVADIYAKVVGIPVIKIDEPMAREAAEIGGEIALIATVETTLRPSKNLIEKAAEELHKKVNVTPVLVKDAWEKLASGDTEGHNRALLQKIKELDKQGYNAIVMAQTSMRAILPMLNDIKTPVLCSFYSGLDNLVRILKNMDARQRT